jgi:hypothetical protein
MGTTLLHFTIKMKAILIAMGFALIVSFLFIVQYGLLKKKHPNADLLISLLNKYCSDMEISESEETS